MTTSTRFNHTLPGRLLVGASLLVAISLSAGRLLPLDADDGTDARPDEIDAIPALVDVPAAVLAALDESAEDSTDDPTNDFGDGSPDDVTEAAFNEMTPARLLDTRKGSNPTKFGELDGTGTPMELTINNATTINGTPSGLPATGISAVALNVTVVDGETNDNGGYLTIYPCGTRPDASNLNYVTGQTIPNAVIAPVSDTGTICIHNYGTAHILIDASGWFSD
jgi:hypothetical protein